MLCLMTTAHRRGVIPDQPRNLRLELARRHIGASQREFAEMLGVSNNTVQRAERGLPMKRSTLLAWGMVTGVDMDWLEHSQGARTGTSARPVLGRSCPNCSQADGLHIRSATGSALSPTPPTTTFEPCRNCWATPRWQRHRYTRQYRTTRNAVPRKLLASPHDSRASAG